MSKSLYFGIREPLAFYFFITVVETSDGIDTRKENGSSEGPLLRELWGLPGKLANLSSNMARQVLQGVSEDIIPHRIAGKQRRSEVEEKERRGEVHLRKKR